MDDLSELPLTKKILPERLKIDVELCGQYLIMKRREQHLQHMISLLEASVFELSSLKHVKKKV